MSFWEKDLPKYLGQFAPKYSNFSHHGCAGHLEKTLDLDGLTVFECDKCGKKIKDGGESMRSHYEGDER